MGHPGGGRASPFFHLFSSLGPIWAPLGSPPQNGAKGLIKGAQSSLWRILFEAIWCRFLMILGGFWNSFLMIFNAMCIVFYVAQNWKMPMADQGTVAGRPKASGYFLAMFQIFSLVCFLIYGVKRRQVLIAKPRFYFYFLILHLLYCY